MRSRLGTAINLVDHGKKAMQVIRRTFYQIATPGIAQTAREASIHKETRFSDHAPLTIEYELSL